MKKSLIAMAVMAAAGAASAQSSVTLFGIVDAAVSRYIVSGGQSVSALSNSGYNSSRLGFRGTEDLGGGLSASFWLEGALQNDAGWGGSQAAGGFDFRRRSTVSLAGGWGELRLGRDYVPTFWNITVFDPFGTNGVGSSLTHKTKLQSGTATAYALAVDPNYVRSNNMVQYFLPANLGGFYGQISYAFDEVIGSSSAGRYYGGRVGFASGPFNVAAAYGQTNGADPTTDAAPDVRDWNIGGQWDFGMAKLLGSYDNARYEGTTSSSKLQSYTIGGLIPVGAGEIRLSYSRAKLDTPVDDPTSSQWAIGYVHNLSKRTALYTTFAHVNNHNTANLPVNASVGYSATLLPGNANHSSGGFDIGVRHSF